jgi:Uncharacterised protein family UPF0047
MKAYTEYLTFDIPARMAFKNITPLVEQVVRASGVSEGLVLCNAMHITASVFINDDEPGLHEDYQEWLEQLASYVAGNQVDTAFLAAIAAACGAAAAVQEEIRGANTARHVGEIAARERFAESFYARVAALTREQCLAYVKGRRTVEAVRFDFDGRILARARGEKR